MRNANDTKPINPIAARDLVLEEPNGLVTESTLRALIDHGWPTPAILAEIPGVSATEIEHLRARAA